jgi:hypothetical protein
MNRRRLNQQQMRAHYVARRTAPPTRACEDCRRGVRPAPGQRDGGPGCQERTAAIHMICDNTYIQCYCRKRLELPYNFWPSRDVRPLPVGYFYCWEKNLKIVSR